MRFTGCTGVFGLVWSRWWTAGSMLPRRLFWDIDPSPTGCMVIHFLLCGTAKWCGPYKVLHSVTLIWDFIHYQQCASLCVYTVCVCTHVLRMCIFVCNLIFLLFVYKASMCANNTLALCVLLDPEIISHITKSCLVYNLLYFTSLRSHVICSCQPTYPLITPCVFCPLFSHWLKGAEVGLPGQYKERGSLH